MRPISKAVDEPVEREVFRFGRDLSEALRQVAESARSQAVQDAVRRQDASGIVSGLDYAPIRNAIGEQQDRLAGEHLRQALAASKNLTAVEAVTQFAMIEPKAINFAAQRAGLLIREVTDQVRTTVSGLVVDALQGDYTYATLAQQIERVVLLTSRAAKTVENVYARTLEQQIKAGVNPVRAETIAQRASTRAAEQSLRRRAEGIARTELMSASNAGRVDGFSAGVNGGVDSDQSRKEWITGGDPCDDCDPLDGEVVMWDQPFSTGDDSPPKHPNCRCVVTFLPPENWAKMRKRRNQDGTYTFEPTLGQSMRLAQIARNYLLGRLTKADHDEAWDRILGFRRP